MKVLAFASAYSDKVELAAAEKALKSVISGAGDCTLEIAKGDAEHKARTADVAMLYHLFKIASMTELWATHTEALRILNLFSQAISRGFGRTPLNPVIDKQCERCKLPFEANYCSSQCAAEDRATHEYQDRANANEWIHQFMSKGAITAYTPPRAYPSTQYTYAELYPQIAAPKTKMRLRF